MYFTLLLKGIILGLSMAAPVGPIGFLCIRRTLAQGRISGLLSGLGTATADAIYSTIAAFGLTIVSNMLISQKYWISLIGGVFLCYLGLKTLFAKTIETQIMLHGKGLIEIYLSTLFLTLTNPMTIMSFMAVFSGLGITTVKGYLAPSVLVLGVFLGSTLWWFILSTSVDLFRSKFDVHQLRWVNIISGIVIIFFGIGALFGMKG